MLKTLNSDQVHFVALLAKTARTQRDVFLGNVREDWARTHHAKWLEANATPPAATPPSAGTVASAPRA